MIRNQTAIIVGAGSSIDIASKGQTSIFPSGAKLLDDIGAALKFTLHGQSVRGGNGTIGFAIQQSFEDDEEELALHIAAANRISMKSAAFSSIDQLVKDEADGYSSYVAKLAIAYFIGEAEWVAKPFSRATTLNAEVRENWFIDLLKATLDQAATLEEAREHLQNLTIVCFNYDRLLEHLLSLFLQSKFHGEYDGGCPNVEYLKIVHPYGMLGPIFGPDGEMFGNRYTPAEFSQISAKRTKGLLTFSEAGVSTGLEVQAILDTSENLVFMGFGFGEENLELILPAENSVAKRHLYATNVDISEPRWETLKDRVASRLRRTHNEQVNNLMNHYHPLPLLTSNGCRALVNDYSLRW